MRSKLIKLSFTIFIAGCLFTACNSGENKGEVADKSQDTIEELRAWIADTAGIHKSEWGKFKTDAEEKIRQNEDSMRVFKNKIGKADTKIKMKYEHEITRLEEKNSEMKTKLAGYKDESKEKWGKFKTNFNNSMDSLSADMKRTFDLY